jgi:hypothetical protein
VTIMKIFIVLLTMIVAYFTIIIHSQYRGSMNYIGPLIVSFLLFRLSF